VNPQLPHYKQVRAFHITRAILHRKWIAHSKRQAEAGLDRRAPAAEIERCMSETGLMKWRRRPASTCVIDDETIQRPSTLVELNNGVIELALHREPCNEIGCLRSRAEKFARPDGFEQEAHALILQHP
jgi:hypothetical protein